MEEERMVTSMPPEAMITESDFDTSKVEVTEEDEKVATNSEVEVQTNPDELDKLGDRMEKFATNHVSPEAPPRKSLSPKERKNSAGSQIPKPEISPKPNFLTKGANIMTQSLNGGNDKVNAKLNGTANMLKSTLRRMTRLSLNTAKPVTSADSLTSSNRSSPEEGKKRSPRSHLSSSGSSNSVARSKSFRDQPPPAYPQRNSALSSSLRRPRNKDRVDQDNRFQRTGTGSTLERGPASGRHTIHRSHSNTHRRFKDRDLNVKKSRAIQTNLTRDVMQDDEGDESASTTVEFSLFMPAVLGNEVDPVETHVTEPTEPVDVRKNRQLTLDNMKLHRELEKLKTAAGESENLKRELRSLKAKFEEEHKSRVRIENQLDKHNARVKQINDSMDTVEKQVATRDENILVLERSLLETRDMVAKLEGDLQDADEVIHGLKNDLGKSSQTQRTLLAQYQEADAESKELQDFLQAEKMTLAETLKDCEAEIAGLQAKVKSKDLEVSGVEERCSHLVRLSEQRQQEILALQAQLSGIQDKAKDMLLAQGAEISRANVTISELQAQLEKMLSTHAPGALTANKTTTAVRQESEEDASMGADEFQPPNHLLPRSQSQFLVSVNSNGSVTNGVMSENTASCQEGQVSESLQNLASAISLRQNSENGQQNGHDSMTSSLGSLPSLADRISDVQGLIERVLAAQKLSQQTR